MGDGDRCQPFGINRRAGEPVYEKKMGDFSNGQNFSNAPNTEMPRFKDMFGSTGGCRCQQFEMKNITFGTMWRVI